MVQSNSLYPRRFCSRQSLVPSLNISNIIINRQNGIRVPTAVPDHPGALTSALKLRLCERHQRSTMCHSNKWDSDVVSKEEELSQNAISVGIFVLWAAFATYAFTMSPNQTPYRDEIFIKLLTGISQDSTYQINPVYFSVFNIIGIYTFIYQCLLIPGGRSANNIPAWPFVVVSYGLGALALLPYFALWRPIRDLELPLPKKELEGWNKLAMRGAETQVLPAIALGFGIYLLYKAFTADGSAWEGYLQLFDESRLVHISTIDCTILMSLTPFWMANDAELRNWKDRETLLPILSFLPVEEWLENWLRSCQRIITFFAEI
ncbi:hypothetical protein CEUSTIGMA_g10878.t1 [Chlamydomonas eustigma]|uniref:Uncharacterized protein n=1 Tax=Chlamydomonas eustigma TaxID=1157962 RepID=A0A250XK96_9CHLO|nr:hypothetical protein CEUSTIGMA_g10878.t1 [Chlamydomonas eustigma]|eukprot:GAX83453.1 hypothetical protein CEUSTIGMA_g10878.t1 [Chlamydomonas eustigma]